MDDAYWSNNGFSGGEMSDVVCYLPEYDEIFLISENSADAIEIGFQGHFDYSFFKVYFQEYSNIDSLYYGAQIEFIGFT